MPRLLAAATPAAASDHQGAGATTKQAIKVETVAKGWCTPGGWRSCRMAGCWSPNGPGRMRIVGKDGKLSAPLRGVPTVYASGQGGLLDVVLSPDFATSGLIYFSYAEPRDGGRNGTTRRARQARHAKATAAGSRTCR